MVWSVIRLNWMIHMLSCRSSVVYMSVPLTSSRISLLRVRSSGRSLISCSMLCSPPCCTMDLAFSAMDCGIESPERSSRAAGRFRDANTLMDRQTSEMQVSELVCSTTCYVSFQNPGISHECQKKKQKSLFWFISFLSALCPALKGKTLKLLSTC